MAKTIFTKDPEKYIPALAEALKSVPEFETPEWAMFVKSGVSRERPPVDDDFWYTRSASILRQLYIHGVVGVGKLRTRYGSKKDRGGKPDRFRKASGKIIRVILQQAEAAGLVEKILRMQHGRRLTQAGRDLLDSIEVEEKVGLDFEDVAAKPVEIVEQDTDIEQTPEEVVEEATEVAEDKGEEVVEEIKEAEEAPKGVPPVQMTSADADKGGKDGE
jgi:small subunit ribosomal protein S19e